MDIMGLCLLVVFLFFSFFWMHGQCICFRRNRYIQREELKVANHKLDMGLSFQTLSTYLVANAHFDFYWTGGHNIRGTNKSVSNSDDSINTRIPFQVSWNASQNNGSDNNKNAMRKKYCSETIVCKIDRWVSHYLHEILWINMATTVQTFQMHFVEMNC